MTKLTVIEGIGEEYARKLQACGITSIENLLTKCATPQDRKQVAEQSGISEKLILEWANHADLFRVRGIGSEYSDLLEAAGVDTVPELAKRNPEHLYQTLVKVNQEKKLVRRLPVPSQVAQWVEQAQKLPRILTY